MKFSIEKKKILEVNADLLVVNMHDGKVDKHSFASVIDKKLGGSLTKTLKDEKFNGKAGQTKLIHTQGKLKSKYVVILGLGDKDAFNLEVIRKGAGMVMKLVYEKNRSSMF